MKSFIHIGLPKAGSRFLQEKIFKKIENSYYIDILNNNLIEILYADNIVFKKNNIKNYIKEINKNKSYLFISSENISNPKSYDQYIICDRLKDTFENAVIIIILRNQIDFLKSFYLHAVASGAYVSFNNFLQYELVNYQTGILPKLDYYNLCSYYSEKFGKENVKIFLYEELFDKNKKFNNDLFESETGISIKKLNLTSEIINISIPVQLLFFRRLINYLLRYDIGQGAYEFTTRGINEKYKYSLKLIYKLGLNRFFKFFNKFFKKKDLHLNKENLKKITGLYNISNSMLEKKYKLNLKHNNYPTEN